MKSTAPAKTITITNTSGQMRECEVLHRNRKTIDIRFPLVGKRQIARTGRLRGHIIGAEHWSATDEMMRLVEPGGDDS